VPSLPGYGWSDPAAKKGLGPLKISVILRNLMLRVGSKKFYVQGGDWGSIIGSNMAAMFPENVIGKSTRLQFPKISNMFLHLQHITATCAGSTRQWQQ
jgi:pimeloyl-ACP methyl ester carboxylesterase